MGSRRDSLEKMDRKLKALAKKLPPDNEQFTYLFRLLEPAKFTDFAERATAVVGAQFLDVALQRAISTYFKTGFNGKEIFDGPGSPLGSFSAKIALAAALGIIDPSEREDLDTIRIIRNAFAHSVTHVGWNDKEVSDLCETLHGYEPLTSSPDRMLTYGPRKLFLAVVSMLYFKLWTYLGPEMQGWITGKVPGFGPP
ncbi:MAG TPA: hypothetical protein VHU23_06105 [Rhizomicrobium sp.]|jgi:hypothetical protein|nr:hypothetical protein [Rhizomicrobium sp.]